MLDQQIQTYLATKLASDDGVHVSNLYQIPGGASRETWSFDAGWSEAGQDRRQGFIIRRDPDASLLVTDRDVEFRVMDAVAAQGVPVPKMYWLEQDGAWLERPFFVMERIDGCETSPQKMLMEPRFYQVRSLIAQRSVEILGRIHAVDWAAAGLQVLGVPEDERACAAMEIERWEAVVDRETLEPQPVLRAALRWLRKHPPAPAQKIVLVHADYRTGNFLCSSEGEIKGVLDWEMTHLGDPMEDVAWACIRPWRWLGDEQIGGLMDRSDFYRLYTEETGLSVDGDAIRFWEVLGNVKLAAIFLTGARSFCDGRTRSAMMALLGHNIGRLELEIMDLMEV
jgi:aminoglycoside phosphotransferase (APT) family kinase protein